MSDSTVSVHDVLHLKDDDESVTVRALVPKQLERGVPMLKISSKKLKQVVIRLDDGEISWAGKGHDVPVSSIRELRTGQPPFETTQSSRCISVVYVRSGQWKVLHMIALEDEVFRLWVNTLQKLVSETSDRLVAQVTPTDPDLLWIRQLWPTGVKTIDMTKAVSLCNQIGLTVPDRLRERRTPLDIDAFRTLIRAAQTRPEIVALHAMLARDGRLDRHEVDTFLIGTQRVNPSGVFDKFAQDDVWSVESLSNYLASPEGKQKAVVDLTHPLSHYFIASSHNTYLVGEQWRGESTVEGYIRVLLAGCRSVEIDIHDGDTEPVAYHRITLTSSVLVRDICQAINRYAFVASPLPIIISAEIHCNVQQQDILVTILREEFGDKLVDVPIDERDDMLPSPAELQNRIMFKAKLKKLSIDTMPSSTSPRELSYSSLPTPITGSSIATAYTGATDSTTTDTDSPFSFEKLRRRLSSASSNTAERPKPLAASPALASILVYTAGVKYQGFSKLVTYQAREQFSVSEKTGDKILRDPETRADWIKHNMTHISRVYPKAIRMLSSNYDPVPFWEAGCQLVALNWQTIDAPSIMNHALFADTSGYVLKPPALRHKVVEVPAAYHIRVQVISAQRLPAQDLYVEATVGEQSKKTSRVDGMALNPAWNETMEFCLHTTASMLDLSFLQLELKNKTQGLVARWGKPVSRAPRGYHYLPLYDGLFSRYVFATLFVRIDVSVTDLPAGSPALSPPLSAPSVTSSLSPKNLLARRQSGRLHHTHHRSV